MSADGEPNDAWHDAMAAHALLQAIDAWGKHPGYQGGASWVEKRAADILAGWLVEGAADGH